ncbi:sister chromatid cohesion 1 protein 1 [Carica papaya]|uniref:sister chromatid cohesion 1 protein 1 n=1 Tax=Carica papaya TaxID=3649 RepID=UPI000B8D06F1|nr:sister chromatid cohesion 1 protein 1 [Carica papaya]
MFYSHQLLARKAPLGQIWRAATMNAKINRRKLDKLDLIKICEEILNPSIPMALRLSGILMGGVVIVYQRKVKLLYEDATRLMIEINHAWKVKAERDPTILPQGRTQAKKEAVTLSDVRELDVGDEQSLDFSNGNTVMRFQSMDYIAMRLDSVDESYIYNNIEEEDPHRQSHQADLEKITIWDRANLFETNMEMHDHFERFEVEGDDEMPINFTSVDHSCEIPTQKPSSPPQGAPERGHETLCLKHSGIFATAEFEVREQEYQVEQETEDQNKQARVRKKARMKTASIMDYEQTIIPGHVYQSWLQNTSDIIFRRGNQRRKRRFSTSTVKLNNLMKLPPVAQTDYSFKMGNGDVPYPAPLLNLWLQHTKSPERSFPPLPPEHSPPVRGHYHEQVRDPLEDFQSRAGSQSLGAPTERQRATIFEADISREGLPDELIGNLNNNFSGATAVNFMDFADDVSSIPSSASGHRLPSYNLEVNLGQMSGDQLRSILSTAPGQDMPSYGSEISSGRSNRRGPNSSSRNSRHGLEPVAEEYPDPNFKLSSLTENGMIPDQELLVETGPTQTQYPNINHSDDKLTDCIRMQMKAHFETPGTAQVESLNKLAAGMNRKAAAQLFYQTCVLATRDYLTVEQNVPYGDIFISRGAKM